MSQTLFLRRRSTCHLFSPCLSHSHSPLEFRLSVTAPREERVGDGFLCVHRGLLPLKASPSDKRQTERKEHSRTGFRTYFSSNLFKPNSLKDKHSLMWTSPAHPIFGTRGELGGQMKYYVSLATALQVLLLFHGFKGRNGYGLRAEFESWVNVISCCQHAFFL